MSQETNIYLTLDEKASNIKEMEILFKKENTKDFTITNTNGKTYMLHKSVILKEYSELYKAAFENSNNQFKFNVIVDDDMLKEFINYMYFKRTKRMDLKEMLQFLNIAKLVNNTRLFTVISDFLYDSLHKNEAGGSSSIISKIQSYNQKFFFFVVLLLSIVFTLNNENTIGILEAENNTILHDMMYPSSYESPLQGNATLPKHDYDYNKEINSIKILAEVFTNDTLATLKSKIKNLLKQYKKTEKTFNLISSRMGQYNKKLESLPQTKKENLIFNPTDMIEEIGTAFSQFTVDLSSLKQQQVKIKQTISEGLKLKTEKPVTSNFNSTKLQKDCHLMRTNANSLFQNYRNKLRDYFFIPEHYDAFRKYFKKDFLYKKIYDHHINLNKEFDDFDSYLNGKKNLLFYFTLNTNKAMGAYTSIPYPNTVHNFTNSSVFYKEYIDKNAFMFNINTNKKVTEIFPARKYGSRHLVVNNYDLIRIGDSGNNQGLWFPKLGDHLILGDKSLDFEIPNKTRMFKIYSSKKQIKSIRIYQLEFLE